MKNVSWVGALKTSTALGGGILSLLACGAFACTEVNVNPIGLGGSAGSTPSGGSSGSVGRGGTGGSNPGNGGSSGADGTAGTGGEGGSSGTVDNGGTGGTSSGNAGTGGTGLLPDGGDPGPVNLVANSDFESGLSPWTMIAQAGTIVLSTDCYGSPEPEPEPDAGADAGAGEPERAHGLQCGRGTGRSANYQGPAYPLTGILARSKSYTVSVYGRIANASSSVLKLTMRAICQDAQGIGMPILYEALTPELPATDSDWLFMTGMYVVPGTLECPVMTDLRFYIEGPPSGVDIIVDDASIYEL